ncbi:TonB-dependent receptor [Emcibacter nanhaiensis]|uniref:TonB-dependent receptor n=1 Tax=Emcibacter nanhaiensis TaxID=1505037 RepID=A0A501PRR7_9PROT|nr:TonB-dependent receptor [Emcibacter nanhaiensis]TPD63229.1 TonB-dependent receptor [Emcibacter nanhaiensis]
MPCKKHTALLLSTVSTLAAASVPTPVLAQEADDFVLEEVIVTARRRAESLSDVPGTVTALTQSTLEAAGVERAADFIALTPGVSMVDTSEVGDTQVNIRGINGARDAENSFAYIIDGVLYTNPAAFNREYTDLTQIEVLKGPQGAIYGRNAAAGAIIVTTAKPGNESVTKLTASAAGDSTYLIKGSTSGAIVEDELFYRLSADWRSTDGYYRNSYQDNAPIVDAFEGFNINGRLVYEGIENLSVDLKMRYGEVDASSLAFNSTFSLPVYAEVTGTESAYQDINTYTPVYQANIISDNDQEAFEVSTKFDYDFEDVTLTGWVLYSDIKNNLIADGTSAAFGFYAADPACIASVSELTGYPLPSPQFIGQTPNGVIFDPNGSFLGAFTPTTCDGIQEQLRNQKDLSAELRLSSNGDGPLSWMIGSYFLDIDRQVGVSMNRDSGEAPIRGLFQKDGPNETASLLYDQFDSRVFAVFGQLEYDVTDTVELSLALRYDNEKREVSSLVPTDATQSIIDLNFDGIYDDPLNPALSSLINSTGTIPDKERTFSQLEPKVSVTWDATDHLTLFASWGMGFKAGGFNNSGAAATLNLFNAGLITTVSGVNWAEQVGSALPVVQDDYDKETSSAFEAGFKADLLGGRLQLNGAGYYTKVTDMQFFEFYVGTFGLLRVVSNIDDVEIYGFELGGTYHLNNHLRFYAGLNMTDSEIKENSARTDTVGNKSPYTPDYTINLAVDFDYPISNDLELFGRADAIFVGPTWFHTVQEGMQATIFQPLFELGLGAGAGALGAAEYSTAQRDAYHTIDLRLGVRGEGWTLTGFVTNLTDENYMEEVIPAPEFGGSFVNPGTERRWGVEMSFEF